MKERKNIYINDISNIYAYVQMEKERPKGREGKKAIFGALILDLVSGTQ